MDKINIKFNYNDYEYCYRVPTDFDWFEMKRIKRFTDKLYVLENVIYNRGKIFLHAFISLKLPDIIDLSYRTEKQRQSMINDFIRVLINKEGKSDITLTFANKLNINVDNVFNYDYSMNIDEFLTEIFEEMNNDSEIKNNIINDAENIINNNPYNVLGIEEKEYSNEELVNIFNNKMDSLLDAYNAIKKGNKILKKIK